MLNNLNQSYLAYKHISAHFPQQPEELKK